MVEPLQTWASAPSAAPPERPSLARRVAAGAWHAFSGVWFLLRNPGLWPLAALPALLALVGIVGGAMLGIYSARGLESAVLPAQDRMSPVLSLILTMAFWTGVMAGGVLVGLALALMLASPALDALSRRVEERQNGGAPAAGAGLRWELTESLKGIAYFLAAAPVVLLLSLIPVVGAPLGLAWGGHALALQQTDPALTRRGLTFRDRRAWHARFRAESLGFGAAGLVLLLVPFANLLLVPAVTVGATRLVMELDD